MNSISKTILAAGLIGTATFAVANPAVNQSALTPSLTTVKQALTFKDDTKVQLRGHVVKATSTWRGGGDNSGDNATSASGSVSTTGESGVNKNMQPYIVLVYIMKL